MKTRGPLLSVIIPCFNAEKWILDSIRSLSEQTYKNFEILVFDDGSTDNSLHLLNEASRNNSSIKVLSSPENKGIVFALNSLVAQSQGEYIARMDADDISHPQRLELQLSHIQDRNVDLCGSWFREFGQGIPRACRWPISHQALEASLLFQNSICHPTIMGKRCVFEEFKYREEFKLAEDYDFFCRAIKKFTLGNLPIPLLNYRRHAAQATQAQKESMEMITKKIRQAALNNIGVFPNEKELVIHNMIRSPESISGENLESIEKWLLFLMGRRQSADFNLAIANQWIRACIRAAPAGSQMRRKYFSSPLNAQSGASLLTHLDIIILSILRLEYGSEMFKFLRRIGLSS